MHVGRFVMYWYVTVCVRESIMMTCMCEITTTSTRGCVLVCVCKCDCNDEGCVCETEFSYPFW